MGRFLCQNCNSIVNDGDDKHPCFDYRNGVGVYTVPPPNELERRHEETEGTHTGNSNDSEGDRRAAAEQNDDKESKETNSLLIENNEPDSLTLVSKKKKNSSVFPSKFLSRMKNSSLDSISGAFNTKETEDNEAETNNSKKYIKIQSASDELPQADDSSNRAVTVNSATLGSAADLEVVPVAGPSGIQTHSKRTLKKKAFKCDVCGKVFVRKHHLDRHLLTHTGEKPFACHKCSKKFSQKETLKEHLLTHSGEKPHTCHVCSKAFALKSNLLVHVRTHTGEKPFKCKFCGTGFVQKSHCNEHEQRKHGEK